jgi:transcriptional regulator of arginine metabolism
MRILLPRRQERDDADDQERDDAMPADSEHREARHQEILTLLRRRPVTSQQEIVTHLGRRGLAATQSSVSRDLRDLGVARVGGRYLAPGGRAAASEAAGPRLDGEVARFLRGVRPAGPHLTVLFTTVGAAQTVGAALDRTGWPEVVGTIAGDDTIFVATAGAADQKRLVERLEKLLSEAS